MSIQFIYNNSKIPANLKLFTFYKKVIKIDMTIQKEFRLMEGRQGDGKKLESSVDCGGSQEMY